MDRVLVAKVGAVAFAWTLAAPVALTGAATPTETVSLASAAAVAGHELVPHSGIAVTPATSAVVLRGVGTTIADLADVPRLPAGRSLLASASTAVVDPTPAPRTASAPSRWAAVPGPEAHVRDGVVVASWYGPRFYGRTTACGQTYTQEIMGVAHRLLRCGTLIQITSPAGITVTVPVIDRGPYITGRALDLSNATRAALSCTDLCHVRMIVLE
ncbi:MAG: septal ring lytic transglycosylase RlpA family protein [Candidatus Limnocylindria bacterium]